MSPKLELYQDLLSDSAALLHLSLSPKAWNTSVKKRDTLHIAFIQDEYKAPIVVKRRLQKIRHQKRKQEAEIATLTSKRNYILKHQHELQGPFSDSPKPSISLLCLSSIAPFDHQCVRIGFGWVFCERIREGDNFSGLVTHKNQEPQKSFCYCV